MSNQSVAASPPANNAPPWLSILNFIGRPNVFFAEIQRRPHILPALLIPTVMATLIPNHVFMIMCINVDPIMALPLQGLCTWAFLLFENAMFAAFSWFVANSLGGSSTYKTMWVACAFAQIPYVLLTQWLDVFFKIQIPFGIYLTLLWSFALSLIAIKEASRLPWFKASLVPVLLFGFSLPLTIVGGSASGKYVQTQVAENKKKERQAELNIQDPSQPDFSTGSQPSGGDSRHPAAPNITLHSADGKETTLSSLRGKVVVLDFWSTWCAPCRRALPFISGLVQSRRDKGVLLFAINTSENKAVAEDYLDKQNLRDVPLCLDLDKANALAMRAYNIPYMVIIDRHGNIQSIHEGYSPSDEEALTMEIDSAIAGE